MRLGSAVGLLAVAAALVCTPTLAGAAAPGAKLWGMRYNGTGNGQDYVNDLARSPDGSKVFVTGTSYRGATTQDDFTTIAYDASTGAEIWKAFFNAAANDYDSARAIAVSPDGTKVFVTGESYGGAGPIEDFLTIAYNAASGAKLWAARYDGPGADYDVPYSVLVSPDGAKVFVSGQSYGGAKTLYDYATLAYDASTGAKLWLARYDAPAHGHDLPSSAALSPGGSRLFVTGQSESVLGNADSSDYATAAYNTSTGTQRWVMRHNGAGNKSDGALAVAVAPDGAKVFVTGHANGGDIPGDDYTTIAYDASTGAKLWGQRYNGAGSGNDDALAVVPSPDGTRVFVTGRSYGGDAVAHDVATLAYNASTGAKLWGARYNGPGSGFDQGSSLAVASDGTKLYVAGYTDADAGMAANDDYLTLSHNTSNGTKLWGQRYNGLGNGSDHASGVVASPDGARLFVSGGSDGAAGDVNNSDFATLAYQG